MSTKTNNMSTGNQIPAELTARYANEPYILLLEEGPYTLSRETLEKHVAPEDLKHKRFNWPDIKFMSLHNGMLELEVTSNEKTFTIAIQVEKDMLQVVCSCATPVEKLCAHAYNTLDKLLLYKKEHYFEQCRSGGLAEFALANKTHFIIKENDEGLGIQSKPAFGKLFSATGNSLTALNNLLLKGIPPATLFKKPENTDVVHGYALIYSGRKFHLPLVLPFIGKLNKAGNAIKSFIDFIRTETGMTELQLTPAQVVLHKKCFRMFKLAEQLPYKIFTDANDLPSYIEWFQLLKQTWFLLLNQPFVYGYYSYHIRILKKRISKQFAGDCQLHAEPVQLSFVLTVKADYYTLKAVFSANGKVLDNKSYEQYSALIMHKENGDFYLLNSLIDIAALEYIGNSMQGLTIFKPYFDEFSNGLLKILCERYPLRCIFPAREQLHYQTILLKPVKKILVIHEHQTGLLLFPFVEYDNGKRVNPLQNGTIYLLEKNSSYVLEKRDKSYEAAFVQQLLVLKEDFASQLTEDCFYIAMEGNEIASWIENLKTTFTDCSIKYP